MEKSSADYTWTDFWITIFIVGCFVGLPIALALMARLEYWRVS